MPKKEDLVLTVGLDTEKFDKDIERCISSIRILERKLAWAELKVAFRNWIRSLF